MSRVSSFGPVVMAMAMDLLEMSIILVYGMRSFFYKRENSFTVDDLTSFVGHSLVRFFLVCQIPIYGNIVVEYVLVGVMSDNMVLGMCFLSAYKVR